MKDVAELTPAEYGRMLAGTVSGRDTPERTALRLALRDFSDSLEFADRQERIAQQALRVWLKEAGPDATSRISASVVAAFLGVLTAMIGTWIAWQQHKSTRSKLRLDLYDRRFAVAEGINKLLSKVVANAAVDIADLHAYNTDTAHAQFLFDADFFSYVELIRDRAVDFRVNRAQLVQLAQLPPAVRDEVIAKDAELLNWFTAQFTEHRSRLGKYIQFRDAL